MNWTVIIVGNIITDSAIAIFAILLGFESYYRWSGDTMTNDLIKRWFKSKTEKQINELQEQLQKKDYEQMEKYSPLGKKLYLIAFLFIIGIALQIFGLIS